MEWNNAIKYYKKILNFESKKFPIYTNIGVAFFKLGKINKSIDAFKKSINENPNFILNHNNLGISYLEIGLYEEAIKHFVFALKLNKNDINAQKNLINIFNSLKPANINDHPLININNEITKIVTNNKIKDFNQPENIKIILQKSNEIIKSFDENLFLNETQIFRRNSKNLNCGRHFKVFNKFNIIPRYCFSCYKVQINLTKIVDLIKLYFVFDNLYLHNNNIRKCIVEIRDKIKGNYKGYIYCEGLAEAQSIMRKIQKKIAKLKINNFQVIIKHGCSEFYKSYPKYEKINFDGEQEMKYDKNWQDKENIIDKESPLRLNADKKILGESIKGINLSDILIIKNWINYADTIEDYSYKLIYEGSIQNNYINNILQNQLDFRKKDTKF